MLTRTCLSLLCLTFFGATIASTQQSKGTDGAEPAAQADVPIANPGRPTVSTPATLTPIGYFQFETGFLGARDSPGVSSQSNVSEVIKFSVCRWAELLVESEPLVHSVVEDRATTGSGDVDLGMQGIVYHGEGAKPTVALSYLGRVYSGGTPDLDIGGFSNSVLLLGSADVKGFHYDANFVLDEVSNGAIRRAQIGQTLSVSHPLGKKVGLTGEIWHFTQPFLRSNAVGNLWAVNYNARSNLVLDAGFDHGLTGTSTQWEAFCGFTYLLPHRVRPH